MDKQTREELYEEAGRKISIALFHIRAFDTPDTILRLIRLAKTNIEDAVRKFSGNKGIRIQEDYEKMIQLANYLANSSAQYHGRERLKAGLDAIREEEIGART